MGIYFKRGAWDVDKTWKISFNLKVQLIDGESHGEIFAF